VTLHPDGRTLALAERPAQRPNARGEVQVFEAGRFNARRRAAGCTDAAFSPDGRLLAVGGEPDGVLIYDTATLAAPRRVPLEALGRGRLVFAPDGQWLAAGTAEGKIYLIDPQSGEIQTSWKAHVRPLMGLAVRADGKVLASSADDGIGIWEVPSGRRLVWQGMSATAVAFAPDGSLLATADNDRAIRLRDPLTGEVIRTLLGHSERPLDLAFNPEGTRLVSGGQDRTVRLWDVSTGKELLQLPGVSMPVLRVAWSADGRRIVATDQGVRLWEAPNPKR
jgi:WD40 repeat protein